MSTRVSIYFSSALTGDPESNLVRLCGDCMRRDHELVGGCAGAAGEGEACELCGCRGEA